MVFYPKFLRGLTAVALLYFIAFRDQVLPHSTCIEVLGATNSTLGFGALYVVSGNQTTWRLAGLRKAAELVGIELTVPKLKAPSDEEVLPHVSAKDSTHDIRAAFMHMLLLDEFVKSGLETALILEDDADFDIHLREQVAVLSEAMLSIGPAKDPGSRYKIPQPDPQRSPYGHETWDLLWLGHCGLEFTNNLETADYKDATALPYDKLHIDMNNYYEQLHGAGAPQQIVYNCAPLCTYAYSITRTHAEHVLQRFRNDHPELIQSYDGMMHVDCKGEKQRCIAAVPSLFHHHAVMGENSLGAIRMREKIHTGRQDLKWYRRQHKYTYNIQWSARCNALKVGEELEEGWQCGPGRYDRI